VTAESTKAKKAKKLGVEVWSEKKFLDFIEIHGFEVTSH
jgi:NAD-dependent DNA ligase